MSRTSRDMSRSPMTLLNTFQNLKELRYQTEPQEGEGLLLVDLQGLYLSLLQQVLSQLHVKVGEQVHQLRRDRDRMQLRSWHHVWWEQVRSAEDFQ